MSYDTGANTWPTGTFAPVGKTYGPRTTGGGDGVVKTEGIDNELVFDITAGTSGLTYSYPLPAGYLVTGLYLEVEEAFAASSTANIAINGGVALTTPLPLATAARTQPALTGLTNTSGAAGVNIVLTPNANALASATGKARLVVRYSRV